MDPLLDKIPGLPTDNMQSRARLIIDDMRRGLYIYILMLVLRQTNSNYEPLREINDMFFWTQLSYYILYIPIQIFEIQWQLDGSFYYHFIISIINFIYATPRLFEAQNSVQPNPYYLIGIQAYYTWLFIKLIGDILQIILTLVGTYSSKLSLLKGIVRGLDLSLTIDSIASLYLWVEYINKIENVSVEAVCNSRFVTNTQNAALSLQALLYALILCVLLDFIYYTWIVLTHGKKLVKQGFLGDITVKGITSLLFIWYFIELVKLIFNYNDNSVKCMDTQYGYQFIAKLILFSALYALIYVLLCVAYSFIHERIAQNLKYKYFKDVLIEGIAD